MSSVTAATPTLSPALNHYLTEVPEKSASALRSKAFAANTLAKIAYAAIVAICATILVFSLFLGTPTGALPFLLLGLALSTPFLAMGAAKLQGMANQFTRLAAIEEGVAAQIKQIRDWKTPEITQFFLDHRMTLENLPVAELAKVNFEEPLCALLPLIARYRYFNERAMELEARYRENLKSHSDFEQLRIEAKRAAAQKLYLEAIPAMLEAAVTLDNLPRPTLELQLSDLGKPKSFQEMVFDWLLMKNDDYFIYNDPSRKPLTLHEIEESFNADALRLRIFT